MAGQIAGSSSIAITDTVLAPPSERRSLSFIGRLCGNPAAMVGLGLVGIYVFTALAASFLPVQDPLEMHPSQALREPSANHILGTDQFGRDMLSRLIFGARVSLSVAVSSVLLSLLVGATVGLLAGYFGGVVDALSMRIMDVFFAFPMILMALGIVAALGPSNSNLVLAAAIVYMPIFARVVRGPVLSLREQEHVEAARCLGATHSRILLHHVLPNVISTIVIQTSLALSWVTLVEATMSFIGLGTQPPLPSWGGILNEGRSFMELAPWMAVYPGLAIMVAVLGFNLLGDGLRDVLDPRL